ncbi:MAG TPA: peptidoglycan DD-metalloendopeptidase family protein [Casimicrobiaceae bacterium]
MHSFSLFRSFARFRLPSLLVAAALVAAACATHRPAPVEERPLGRGVPSRAATAPGAGVPTPEAQPAATYTVRRGDTLHQIALDSGLDYRELAAWNNLENVNRIYPGQVLRLTAPGEPAPAANAAPPMPQDGANGVTTAPLRTPPAIVESNPAPPPPPNASPSAPSANRSPSAPPSSSLASSQGSLKTSPKAVKLPYSEQAVRDLDLAASAAPAPREALTLPPQDAKPESRNGAAAAPPPAAAPANATPAPANAPPASAPSTSTANDSDRLDWAWPAKGKIVTAFSETANLKGIDIAGTAGEPVRASAAGRVVYAGDGLRGYGKLIIIKHNNTYLSAYAHNREILVKEGQQVTRGQKIAEMGKTDADQVKLHFEIRRHGKPMDPTKFLPPA